MGTVKSSEGFPQAQVRLADIDGDGRADYVVFDATATNAYFWRNAAQVPGAPTSWFPKDLIFAGLPAKDLSGWRFTDLTGSKKDDLVWVGPKGQVTTWINRRGLAANTLAPEWVSVGVTHQAAAGNVNVTFGNWYGSGRSDYALTSVKNGNVYVDRFRNLGSGGTTVKADGTRFCSMVGSGSDDYVYINATGAITLFENQHNWGYWVPWGVIYNANRVRQEIHLADWGMCYSYGELEANSDTSHRW